MQTVNLLEGKDEISNLVGKIVLIRDQCYILFLIHEKTQKNKALFEQGGKRYKVKV